ncbi:tetratricopeptide repeat protein [Nonomuraea bangladeshensis]|uniref:tetratricopeptide repeat protein n=1 Tax=Nonomuraea bangladeshensis TaxID=404385 RepID=UPI003C2D6C52
MLDCAWSLRWFAGRWIQWPYWPEVFGLGAKAGTALGDPGHQAALLRYLAVHHTIPQVDPEVELRAANEVLDYGFQSGWGAMYVGRALLRLGQPDEAIVSVSRSAEMFKADSELEAYSQSLGLLGECLRGAGRHAEALELYTEMYELTSDENSGMTPSVAALTLFEQFPVAPSKGRYGAPRRIAGRGGPDRREPTDLPSSGGGVRGGRRPGGGRPPPGPGLRLSRPGSEKRQGPRSRRRNG